MSEGYVAGIQAGPAAVAFDTSHVALSRGNKLYRANGDRFHYDARDHVVAREGSWGRVTYVRDGLGRLRRIDWTSPDGSRTATTWEAEYDALGRRTKKVVHRVDASGAPVRDEWRFVWDRDRLAAEVLPDGRLRVYVYPDAVALVPMLALEYASTTSDPREGRVYSFHTDHRGAVERVEDAAGNVVWEAELGPYGEATVVVGPDFHQPFRLVGQYYDAETGLCAHRYRMYSPELGRFLESDPIGLQGGLNVYAWPGCPLVATDPLGLGCPDADAASATPPAETEGTPVREGDVDSYRELHRRATKGDNLEHDHIPAKAAVRDAINAERRRQGKPELTPAETRRLYDNLTALEVTHDMHAAGRTYKGRGGAERQATDAADLRLAAERDMATHRETMIASGRDPAEVDAWAEQVHARNEAIGLYDETPPSSLWEAPETD